MDRKYSIGEKLFALVDNKIQELVVSGIQLSSQNGMTLSISEEEIDLFKSKEELVKSL